jgi:8-amino-3,8-dideoxy-alpha-D-manno-octulosonate transaminase
VDGFYFCHPNTHNMPGTELFGEEEKKEVMDVLNTGVLFRYNHDAATQGPLEGQGLRSRDRQVHRGAKYALAVSSGSTAVSTMLAACGVGYGDHVIVPPFTFVATIEAVLLAGCPALCSRRSTRRCA